MSKAERHEFQAEVQQLLDLMVHSLYSNKDIFLRELISNASDALDKLRFEGLTDKALLPEEELCIWLKVDPEARTLSISDNGIGMSRDQTVEDLGTIARSGTKQFAAALAESKGKELPPELIGQFGVGFYASFMVADEIDVVTRKAGEETATRWTSEGAGSFEIADAERDHAGTTITLKLKEADEEDGRSDYAMGHVIRQIVKQYSDFVGYPVYLEEPQPEPEAKPEGEDDAEADEGEAEDKAPVALNSMKAIWTRPASEVTDEERDEFYKHISHDWTAPLCSINANIEGTIEAKALLFIPSQAPFDLYWREQARRGVHLYVRRVYIMDDCQELLPEYLRFVRGVVDAEDLSLNVSREILQQDRQVKAIRKFLVKKLLDEFTTMAKDDKDKYSTFWEQFGQVLKEGLAGPEDQKDKLLGLLRCQSSHDEKELTSLAGYVERMKEGQDEIYFITGQSREGAERSPHLERFKEKGYEVLYLLDPIDELWAQRAPEFEGKSFVSVGKGEVELGTEEEKEKESEERKQTAERFGSLLECLKGHLDDVVSDVRVSGRLKSSPACLVGEEGQASPAIEEMMRQAGQDVPKSKRTLEVNPSHPLMTKLEERFQADAEDAVFENYARLLHGQALLAEGGRLEDPAEFSRLLADLMTDSLGAS